MRWRWILWLILAGALLGGGLPGHAQSPSVLFETTCPDPLPTNQCCYDTDQFFFVCGTGSGVTTLSVVATPLTVTAAGTAYALTTTPALVDFGTTDPVLVLDHPGTYLLYARVAGRYTGATFAANQTITLTLRRTNNTAADLADSTVTLTTRILTTTTDHLAVVPFPVVLYTTANNDDSLEIQGSVDVAPSAGSVDVYEASLVAVRLY